MESVERLKQEILNQKKVIEEMGGSVIVLNNNPSPSEITQGIKSLPIPDFSVATANESDVASGKTFFAQNNVLKTGTLEDSSEMYEHIFNYTSKTQTSNKRFDYEMPSNSTVIRKYFTSENYNNINFYFNNEIKTISSYAFNETPNFNFYNLGSMSNLQTIESYAFNDSNPNGLNLSELPNGITKIDTRAFNNMVKDGDSINIPTSAKTLGAYAFYCDEIKFCNQFILSSSTPITTLSAQMLMNLNFNSDLYVPSTVTQVASKFNYNGSFNNITFPTYIRSLGNNCFNADSTVPLSDIKLRSVTFLSTLAPTLGTTVFSEQAIENGLSIYVPDEAIDVFKDKMANYVNCIKPLSQKP